ncbi:MAG: hypothetical protein HYY46_20335 [Deltaproteobacteria bacterium]|nr:hypothetical protein [Deltaproteobacteria bacterium]
MRVGSKAALTFDVTLMALLLGILGSAMKPDFDGGHLIALVAAFTAGSLTWVILKDYLWAFRRRAGAPARAPSEEVDASAPGLNERWLAVVYTVLMFTLVYVFGTLAGCILFVGAFLSLHKRGNPWLGIALALVVGGLFPYVLGGMLGLRLWEGVIPVIVPGWIGGGVPAPL